MAQTDHNVYELLKSDPRRIYVIAEAGLNHGGSRERALTLVRAAKWAGADAVKFQISRAAKSTPTKSIEGSDLKKLELPLDAFRAIHKEAQRLGIDFISTPVDEESADFLDGLGVQAFKIADIENRAVIEHASRKGKPLMIATGLSSVEGIERAIGSMHTQSNEQVILLHCVPSYPAKAEELNLKSVEFLRNRFGVPVGFSDQSAGSLGSLVATSLGAQVIERHFMIENRPEIPDTAISMDAKQLKSHIEELRKVSAALGQCGNFAEESRVSRRSFHVNKPIEPVEIFPAAKHHTATPASENSPRHVTVAGKQAAAAHATRAPRKRS